MNVFSSVLKNMILVSSGNFTNITVVLSCTRKHNFYELFVIWIHVTLEQLWNFGICIVFILLVWTMMWMKYVSTSLWTCYAQVNDSAVIPHECDAWTISISTSDHGHISACMERNSYKPDWPLFQCNSVMNIVCINFIHHLVEM